ncbi:MAG: alpha/beta hydrolase [Actinobacteria bacterium]|nr:alpha/beta hydrolase [Actinomycetota bacterium]
MNKLTNQFDVEDVVYLEIDGCQLLARLYKPSLDSSRGPYLTPAVVSIHGGRWCDESRLTNEVIDSHLAANGVFVMAIDFRMPPKVKFPLPVSDINYAIRWLKKHAQTFGVDLKKIGGIGTSSGGHQLLLNALRPKDELYASRPLDCECDFDASLAFAIACWPVSDPLERYLYALEKKMQLHVECHHAYWKDEAEMATGSPQRILAEGHTSHMPPLLLIQGTDDTVLSPGMTQKFAMTYEAAGGKVTLCEFMGQTHTFITKFPLHEASLRACRAISNFAFACGDVGAELAL